MHNNLKDMQVRLKLSEKGMANYLGVPVHTYRKWINGTRTPNASAVHLIELLGILEALAPNIVSNLIEQAKDAP